MSNIVGRMDGWPIGHLPHSKDEGVGFDDFPVAVESDICVGSIYLELGHLGHQGGGGHVHPE